MSANVLDASRGSTARREETQLAHTKSLRALAFLNSFDSSDIYDSSRSRFKRIRGETMQRKAEESNENDILARRVPELSPRSPRVNCTFRSLRANAEAVV